MWNQTDDLALLQFIVDLDLVGHANQLSLAQTSQEIDFVQLSKGDLKDKSEEQCRQRWFVLVKSSGSGYLPGQRIEPSTVAEKLVNFIENKGEKYAQIEE